ncbi:MAG: hypothetical protein Q9174_003142 [Haloplaca sp. 1 TL-2023]
MRFSSTLAVLAFFVAPLSILAAPAPAPVPAAAPIPRPVALAHYGGGSRKGGQGYGGGQNEEDCDEDGNPLNQGDGQGQQGQGQQGQGQYGASASQAFGSRPSDFAQPSGSNDGYQSQITPGANGNGLEDEDDVENQYGASLEDVPYAQATPSAGL